MIFENTWILIILYMEGFTVFRVAIITLSDLCYSGKSEDMSGPLIEEIVNKVGYKVVYSILLPNDKKALASELADLSDGRVADLILTTGGIGLTERDNTPEATMSILEEPTSGISQSIRHCLSQRNPKAMLSRAAAGIRKSTLIINLPESPELVSKCLRYIMPSIYHGLNILHT